MGLMATLVANDGHRAPPRVTLSARLDLEGAGVPHNLSVMNEDSIAVFGAAVEPYCH